MTSTEFDNFLLENFLIFNIFVGFTLVAIGVRLVFLLPIGSAWSALGALGMLFISATVPAIYLMLVAAWLFGESFLRAMMGHPSKALAYAYEMGIPQGFLGLLIGLPPFLIIRGRRRRLALPSRDDVVARQQ